MRRGLRFCSAAGAPGQPRGVAMTADVLLVGEDIDGTVRVAPDSAAKSDLRLTDV